MCVGSWSHKTAAFASSVRFKHVQAKVVARSWPQTISGQLLVPKDDPQRTVRRFLCWRRSVHVCQNGRALASSLREVCEVMDRFGLRLCQGEADSTSVPKLRLLQAVQARHEPPCSSSRMRREAKVLCVRRKDPEGSAAPSPGWSPAASPNESPAVSRRGSIGSEEAGTRCNA